MWVWDLGVTCLQVGWPVVIYSVRPAAGDLMKSHFLQVCVYVHTCMLTISPPHTVCQKFTPRGDDSRKEGRVVKQAQGLRQVLVFSLDSLSERGSTSERQLPPLVLLGVRTSPFRRGLFLWANEDTFNKIYA